MHGRLDLFGVGDVIDETDLDVGVRPVPVDVDLVQRGIRSGGAAFRQDVDVLLLRSGECHSVDLHGSLLGLCPHEQSSVSGADEHRSQC